MSDTKENLEASVTAAQQEIAAQLASAARLEARLTGFLGLLVAAGGIMLTATHGLASSRWILFVGASVGLVFILVGLAVADELKSGPNAGTFYDQYGGGTAGEFLAQLLADLRETIFRNGQRIEGRQALFTNTLAFVAIFALWFGLVRLFQ